MAAQTDVYNSHLTNEEHDLPGVSVFHLANNFFIKEDRANHPESAEDTTIYEIKDLRKPKESGNIRKKGQNTTFPIDGKQGAVYVHTLVGAGDHVQGR